MNILEVQFLRRLVLPLFARFNPGDVTIKHHHTGERFRLHSFRHKGYWYHGRNRERDSMALFKKLIAPGDTVVEVGGHIGYVSLLFLQLAGEGHVFVFEPGDNNLPYIRRNLEGRGIELIEKAAGDHTGTARFFIESLTGQNNSFVENFDGLRLNRQYAGVGKVDVRTVEVEMVRLDEWAQQRDLHVDFVKIDVEGYEWNVLQGMLGIVRDMRPRLMVEVQRDRKEILDCLTQEGYLLFSSLLLVAERPEHLRSNVFALHREKHCEQIAALGLQRRAEAVRA